MRQEYPCIIRKRKETFERLFFFLAGEEFETVDHWQVVNTKLFVQTPRMKIIL